MLRFQTRVRTSDPPLASGLTPIPKNSHGTSSIDSQESGCAVCYRPNSGQDRSLLIFDREIRFP